MESDYTKEVYDRIQKLDPENVSKIVGYLMLQDDGGRDMIRLAFSPDNVLCSLINKAKIALGLSKPTGSVPISPLQATTQLPVSDLPFHLAPYPPAASTRPSLSPTTTLLAGGQYWDLQVPADQQILHNPDLVQQGYADSTAEDYHFQNQMQMLSLEDQFEYANSIASDFSSNYHCPEPAMGVRTSRRSPTSPEFRKVCHYFNKGFCKHGNACRYLHSHNPMTGSFPHIFTSNSNELTNDDHVISPGSLEKLERELTELLKSRRGSPISIASLPMTYYEKYGRTLQAEGYLTESQRHGKAGYSLTKLLARLKNSIRVIDRPHGQHSVILAEDVPRYLEYAGDKNEPGSIVAGSQQIYLTFPADSSFSEQDVSNYFNKYGPVRDVRIPCQQKRMFGFVTFVYPETVKQILSKGNPHFVCGARVLVKPYREKSKLVERKLTERMLNPMCFHQNFTEGDSELNSSSRMFENSSLLRKQLMLENEQTFELERCFAEMNLNAKPLSHPPHYGYSIDELKLQEPRAEPPFNYLFNALNTASTSEEKLRNISTNYKDKDSQGLDLPESLFTSAIGSLSTVL